MICSKGRYIEQHIGYGAKHVLEFRPNSINGRIFYWKFLTKKKIYYFLKKLFQTRIYSHSGVGVYKLMSFSNALSYSAAEADRLLSSLTDTYCVAQLCFSGMRLKLNILTPSLLTHLSSPGIRKIFCTTHLDETVADVCVCSRAPLGICCRKWKILLLSISGLALKKCMAAGFRSESRNPLANSSYLYFRKISSTFDSRLFKCKRPPVLRRSSA